MHDAHTASYYYGWKLSKENHSWCVKIGGYRVLVSAVGSGYSGMAPSSRRTAASPQWVLVNHKRAPGIVLVAAVVLRSTPGPPRGGVIAIL